jgi:hypothetical protein
MDVPNPGRKPTIGKDCQRRTAMTTTMNISLPEPLREFVDSQVKQGGSLKLLKLFKMKVFIPRPH